MDGWISKMSRPRQNEYRRIALQLVKALHMKIDTVYEKVYVKQLKLSFNK